MKSNIIKQISILAIFSLLFIPVHIISAQDVVFTKTAPEISYEPVPASPIPGVIIDYYCPEIMPTSPDFCQDGEIISGGKNEYGCDLPPLCSKPIVGEPQTCPVGCVCENDTQICSSQVGGPVSTIIEGQTMICPEGCECFGEIIACQSNQSTIVNEPQVTEPKPLEPDVKVIGEPTYITISESADGVLINVNGTEITSSEPVSVQQSKLMMETSSEPIQIKPIESQDLVNALKVSEINSVVLENNQDNPVYSIRAHRKGKIIKLIPTSVETIASINAQTGQIISSKTSWWNFLVW